MESVECTFNDGYLSICDQEIEGLPRSIVDEYAKRTSHLDLSFNIIKRVQYLEFFQALEHLVLDNNEIMAIPPLPVLKRLTTLSLNNNRISDIDLLLDNLKEHLPNLTHLSLLKNPCCPNSLTGRDSDDYRRYRLYVLYKLPGLGFLDTSEVSKKELGEARRIGQFQKVAKPKNIEAKPRIEKPKTIEGEIAKERTLPETKKGQEASATFGQTKYVYFGRHSEGNRFIKDDDL